MTLSETVNELEKTRNETITLNCRDVLVLLAMSGALLDVYKAAKIAHPTSFVLYQPELTIERVTDKLVNKLN